MYIPVIFRGIFGLLSRYLKICIHDTPRFIAEPQTMLGKHRSTNVRTIPNHHSEQSGHSTRRKTNVMHYCTIISRPQTSQTRRYVTYEDRQR